MILHAPISDSTTVVLDPSAMFFHASGPVLAVLWLLVLAAGTVWWIFVVKLRQLSRWSAAERQLARVVGRQPLDSQQLLAVARHHRTALGSMVLETIALHHGKPDVIASAIPRVMVEQRERATAMLSLLASIGSTAPFVGLLGTVYGIMDAFLRIGREQSASLPVVAPAIGEALLATAVGLFAAIPAVLLYNSLSARAELLLSRVEAAAQEWAVLAAGPRS